PRATYDTPDSMATDPAPAPAASARVPAGVTAPTTVPIYSGEVRSSPLVRKIARYMNINLAAVAGRGVAGRVTKKDMLNFIHKLQLDSERTPTQTALATTFRDGVELLDGVAVRRQKMTKMRQLIATHMVDSVHTSPHVTTVF